MLTSTQKYTKDPRVLSFLLYQVCLLQKQFRDEPNEFLPNRDCSPESGRPHRISAANLRALAEPGSATDLAEAVAIGVGKVMVQSIGIPSQLSPAYTKLIEVFHGSLPSYIGSD